MAVFRFPESSGGGGGSSTFTGLSDTPSSYSGQALKATRVNAGETGLEFYVPGTLADGDKGDITVSGSGATWTIDNNAVTTAKIADNNVTLAKIENISTSHFLGRHTAGSGAPEQVSASQARTILNVEDGADVTDNANVGSSISGATAKTTPIDADTMPLIDSADSSALKKVTWSNIKATLKTYFDTLYQAVLVSGTNIKTINSQSLLGSGNISISASAPSWTTATASTASANSIDLSSNYYVEVAGDADFNLTAVDPTDLQTGIRHVLVFIPATSTRTITNGLTSMDNFGGSIPVTTSERFVCEIFKDNTGNVNVVGSVVS